MITPRGCAASPPFPPLLVLILVSLTANHITQATYDEETSTTMSTTDYHNNHVAKRGSSASPLEVIPARNNTVTKNVNKSPAVSEEHRVEASEYLASYIKVRICCCRCCSYRCCCCLSQTTGSLSQISDCTERARSPPPPDFRLRWAVQHFLDAD